MTNYDYVIVGGGVAGTTAAETIRTHDPNSSITIFTEEPDRLYSRVLLPHYLRNENTYESLFVRKPESYTEKNLNLKTNTKITKIDTGKQIVVTNNGEEIVYKKLLIASGGKVNKLNLPGKDLKGIFYLRTLQNAKEIKDYLENATEATVLGGGFIGIEFAQSFIKNGLKTKAVIRERYFWENVVGENSGKLLSEILKSNGVEVLNDQQVTEFVGQEKIENVKLANNESLNTGVVGVGIGIHLDLEYLAGSNLATKTGVVTNEYLETSERNVWAAGDIAEFYDPIFHRYHTLGNWANASAQGRAVGLNMASEKKPFETTSMYSINIFGVNFSFLGDPIVDEKTEVIERGTVGDKKLSRLLIREDRIVGASLINSPLERNALGKLIKDQTKISVTKDKLSDLSLDLNSLLV